MLDSTHGKSGRRARARLDVEQTVLIRASFVDSDQTYGARRVRRDLRDWGHRCGVHRIERLMALARLEARPKRRRLPFDLGTRCEHAIAPNVLDRRFNSEAPNNKWVADFTYLWTSEGWLYVAVVLDLFSRRAVGWSMSSQMTSQLVTDAMLMAIWRRGPVQALLSHSDQGSQYTSEQFQRLLSAHGVTCSMSRSGNCWDTQSRIYTERPVQSDSCWDWHHAFALTCRLDRGVPRLLPGPSFVT